VVSATTQIAAVVIITAIITPMLTSFVAKKYVCPKLEGLNATGDVIDEINA